MFRVFIKVFFFSSCYSWHLLELQPLYYWFTVAALFCCPAWTPQTWHSCGPNSCIVQWGFYSAKAPCRASFVVASFRRGVCNALATLCIFFFFLNLLNFALLAVGLKNPASLGNYIPAEQVFTSEFTNTTKTQRRKCNLDGGRQETIEWRLRPGVRFADWPPNLNLIQVFVALIA